jgi:hypothetical protein
MQNSKRMSEPNTTIIPYLRTDTVGNTGTSETLTVSTLSAGAIGAASLTTSGPIQTNSTETTTTWFPTDGALRCYGGAFVRRESCLVGRCGIGWPSDPSIQLVVHQGGAYPQVKIANNATYSTLRTPAAGGFEILSKGGATNPITIGNVPDKNDVTIVSNTASTTTGTGCLILGGGMGAAGAVNAGGAIKTTSATASTTTATGSIIAGGGIGAAGAINAGGAIKTTDTTASTTTATGSIIAGGGAGIAGNATIGGVADVTGITKSRSGIQLYDTAAPFTDYTSITPNGASTEVSTTRVGGGNLEIRSTVNQVYISSTAPSTTTATGALRVTGGAGIGERVTATNITCLTAPVATTDVVRLSDITGSALAYVSGFEGTPSSTAALGILAAPFRLKIDISSNTVYWANSTKKTLTAGTLSCPITLSPGIKYFYLDSAGALGESLTYTDALRTTYCIVATVTMSSANVPITVGNEMHAAITQSSLYSYLHAGLGTVYESGLGLAGFTIGDGSADSHAQFTVDGGVIRDEELSHAITPKTLSGAIVIYYRSGLSGWLVSSTTGAFYSTGATLQYNLNTAGTWSLANVANGKYVLGHVFASNDLTLAPAIILGQNEYLSSSAARSAASTEVLSLITTGIDMREFIFIGTVIYQCGTSYANASKGRVIEVSTGVYWIDWRTNKMNPVATSGMTHSNLGGLLNDDHTQYVTVAGRSGDAVSIPNTTASTTTATGCLTLGGGMGALGAINAGGVIKTTNATAATNRATGSIIAAGGIGAAGSIWGYEGDFVDLKVSNTTASTNTTTGCIVASGGVGIAGAVNTGGAIKTTDTTATTNRTTGSIIAAGGIGCSGDLHCTSIVTYPTVQTLTGTFDLGGPASHTFYLRKLDKMVTMYWGFTNGTLTGTSASLVFSEAVPAGFRPAAQGYSVFFVTYDGTGQGAIASVNTSTGVIELNLLTIASWTSGKTIRLEACSGITWITA